FFWTSEAIAGAVKPTITIASEIFAVKRILGLPLIANSLPCLRGPLQLPLTRAKRFAKPDSCPK
ncbi:MAG: hypothetical protein ABIS51_02335, partial [Sphingomonas sp.]